MSSDEAVWSRSPHVAFVDDGADRVLLLDLRDPRDARPTLLAGPGAVIWRAMNGPCPEDEIVAKAAKTFARSEREVQRDVLAFLRGLRTQGLVDFRA